MASAPATPAPGRRLGAGVLRSQRLVLGLPLLALLYLILVPLLFTLFSSFRLTRNSLPFDPSSQFTFQNYLDILTAGSTWRLLLNTFLFSLGALAIGLGLAGGLAWLVERTDMPLRTAAYVGVMAPIAMPGIIVSLAWILLLSPNNGFVNALLRALPGIHGPGPLNVYSLPSMLFIQGLIIVPTTFLLISPAFRLMDSSLEEAGALCGAGRWAVFRAIQLPLLLPAVANAAIFQFTTVVQAFDVPAVIGLQAGVPLLSTKIFQVSSPTLGLPDYGTLCAWSLLLLLLSSLPLLWYSRVTRVAARFATMGGKGSRPRRVRLGRLRWLALAAVALYVAIALVLPAGIMAWMSFQPFYANPGADSLRRLTLAGYRAVLGAPEIVATMLRTVVVGVVAATVCTALALVVGWMIVRVRGRLSRAVDLLSFAPHVIPGVVIGVSVLLFYLVLGASTPLRLHATPAELVIALVTITLGFSIRAARAAVLHVHVDLEEAATVAGVSLARRIRHVVGPLIRSAVGNVWIWVFIQAVTNLTLALILYAGSNALLSTEIFRRWNQGLTSSAAALGTMLMVLSLALAAAVRRVSAGLDR